MITYCICCILFFLSNATRLVWLVVCELQNSDGQVPKCDWVQRHKKKNQLSHISCQQYINFCSEGAELSLHIIQDSLFCLDQEEKASSRCSAPFNIRVEVILTDQKIHRHQSRKVRKAHMFGLGTKMAQMSGTGIPEPHTDCQTWHQQTRGPPV